MATDANCHCGSGAAQLPPPANLVIFGATGDLTKRKLMPALLRMLRCGLLHPDSQIVGVVRGQVDSWRESIAQALLDYSPAPKPTRAEVEQLQAMLVPVEGALEERATYQQLAESLKIYHDAQPALFYCAIPPQWYETVINQLGRLDSPMSSMAIVAL